jgi:hypothetical protein
MEIPYNKLHGSVDLQLGFQSFISGPSGSLLYKGLRLDTAGCHQHR